MQSQRHVLSSSRSLALGLVLAFAGAPLALAVQQTAKPEPHPILGDPLVINGETIPTEEIKRQIVFGPLGVEILRLERLKIFVEQEIAREVEAGADPKKFQVEQADIDFAIAEAKKQIDEVYAGQDVLLDELYPTTDPAWLENVKLTQQFNRVFLPDNPHEFPQVTIDALEAGAQEGGSLYTHMVNEWDTRQGSADAAQDPVGKAMLAMITNQTVIKHLESSADIVSDPAKLPAGVAMRVNGVDMKIDDLWQKVLPRLTEREVEMAKRWIVNTRLLEEGLRSSGHWLSDEAFEKAYEAYTAPYKDSPFSIESIAVRFQKFPTVEAYQTYYRISESMKGRIRYDMRNAIERKDGEEMRAESRAKAERLVAEGNTEGVDKLEQQLYEELLQDRVDQRWDEQLVRTSATRTSRLAGDARVQADIILVSAYDFGLKRWKQNGWEEAEARTKRLVQDLADNLPWNDAVERYSDFYDAPIPTGQTAQVTLNNKGRFRSIARNELMKRLEESVYSGFLFGETLTDYIFFDMPVGPIQDPIKGPYGYYVAKLYTRGGPKRMLDFENADHRDLIEQDFVALRVQEYLGRLIEENEVYGIGS